jgi:hypothetical protein
MIERKRERERKIERDRKRENAERASIRTPPWCAVRGGNVD